MAPILLITGGSRSGKSDFAQQLAESQTGPHVFIATCPRLDVEMEDRIRQHRNLRQGRGWQTVEEPLDPAARLADCPEKATILIDCLTLWINNLLYAAGLQDREPDEDEIRQQTDRLVRAAREHRGTVIMVTNEVGLGIVPENRLARLYRDLVGRCNQCVGRQADRVYLISCGVPLQLKG